MGPIELTDLHKSKLLEMCKDLFPEIFVVTIQENGYLNYSDTGKTIDYEDRFHWFEFCMTHLADKIFEDHDNFSNIKDGFITIFSIKDEHPIDYLYEQFKQLK